MRILTYAILINLLNFSCMNDTLVYEYADGNGNSYKLNSASLQYTPVKKEESSSGLYSGGEAKTVTINSEQFKTISTLLESALNNTAIHTNERVMMSGVVRVTAGENKRSCIVRPGSDEILKIEQSLKAIVGR